MNLQICKFMRNKLQMFYGEISLGILSSLWCSVLDVAAKIDNGLVVMKLVTVICANNLIKLKRR